MGRLLKSRDLHESFDVEAEREIVVAPAGGRLPAAWLVEELGRQSSFPTLDLALRAALDRVDAAAFEGVPVGITLLDRADEVETPKWSAIYLTPTVNGQWEAEAFGKYDGDGIAEPSDRWMSIAQALNWRRHCVGCQPIYIEAPPSSNPSWRWNAAVSRHSSKFPTEY